MPRKTTSSESRSSRRAPAVDRDSELERGRLCYERRAWVDAHDALARADALAPLGLEDLERVAWSAGLAGRDEERHKAGERLYHQWFEAGDRLRAAYWAFWAGFRLVALGEVAQGSGWLARAARIVEGEGNDCAVRGYLLLPDVRRHLVAGQLDAAFMAATSAAEIGERFAEGDLVACARQLQGQILLRRGQIERGLALLDEAMLSVTAGELSPVMTGIVYCGAIAGCHRVYALDRAREWTRALGVWCDAQPQLAPFSGNCVVYRAEVLLLGGAWTQAIEEASRGALAVERQVTADALYQKAEIHRLRGELGLAEEAYRDASQRGREPQPGLALLRLAQGQPDAAASAMRRVVQAAGDPLERTRLLPSVVEVSLAVGDLEGARAACEELERTAAHLPIDVVGAMAAHARGAIQLAAGDAKGAVAPLRLAFRIWQDAGAPYIAARIRVSMARACRALGDEEAAALELDAAREVFERVGAVPDMAAVDGLRSRTSPAPPHSPMPQHGLSPRELEVLLLVAAGKTNKVIARALFLSEKTVDRHVSNIFAKLNVTSRSAATAYAYEHDLVVRSA